MNTICNVFDGLFDTLYLYEFFYNVMQPLPINFTNIANRSTSPYGFKGSHCLLGTTIFNRKSINDIGDFDEKYFHKFYEMFDIITNKLNMDFYLSAITTNTQPYGIDGTTHMDAGEDEDDEYTILVMTNPEWKKEWGGQFQLIDPSTAGKSNRVIEEHEYVPGRVVIVPSNHPHRGLAPTEKYIYRTSVVFRVSPNFEKYIPYRA